MDPLRAVVLAGGLGTRLGPLAEGLPKAMVPVGGRPFLDYVVQQLAGQGFKEILLLVGYRAELLEAHFGEGSPWGIRIRYSRESEPMGTGGALHLAREFIQGPFLLLYGDLFRTFDYAGFLGRHEGDCLAVYPYLEGLTTIACPNVGYDAAGGQVLDYLKNAPEAGLTHVDAGFGRFRRETLDLLPAGKSSFEETVYPALARSGALAGEEVDRDFFDIGNPEDLAHARACLGAGEPAGRAALQGTARSRPHGA